MEKFSKNAGILSRRSASSAGGSADAAKDDGDAGEKAVPVGEHEVQRVVIRYNDGFEGYPGVFSGKQAYEFVYPDFREDGVHSRDIRNAGVYGSPVSAFSSSSEIRFMILSFPEMAGMKRIDDQNFGGGQRSRPLRHISKGHRLCRENGAEQTRYLWQGGQAASR